MSKRAQTKLQRQVQVNTRLRNENAKLRMRVKVLAKKTTEQAKIIEYLRLQIEELQRIIFGSGQGGGKDNDKDEILIPIKQPSQKRSSQSYRRTIPTKTAITDVKSHRLHQCPKCNSKVSDIKEIERYTEDILPMTQWYKALKKVTKETIETGYCNKCSKRVMAKPIAPQPVNLGENVKQFVAFSTIILRLRYEQVKDFLEGTIKLRISDGEIANILGKQAGQLRPAFERLKKSIRGQPGAHFDETGWKVQAEEQGNYAWVITETKTANTVFSLGKSRGKGNIDKLRGNNNANQIGISDDYGAYQNAFLKGKHALCWAHPHRKLRDLKNSASLPTKKQEHCHKVYEEFARLYSKVQQISTSPFRQHERVRAKKRLLSRFEEITQPHPLDPLKLRQIKKRLLKQKECYFVCIVNQDIPPDNNKAERALRHLVLKRKNSYGSKTQAGADRMSVLYSVLLSAWWKSKDTFFQEYSQQFPESLSGYCKGKL
ncbi:MAG: IS66 family transposase [Parcubacteria group bacterium]